ncbi:MAG: VWA domain-containing protein [Coraliomargaritaceae bacterium]
MNFANPIWLYLAPAIFLTALALILRGLQKREHLLAQFAARRLLEQLTERAALGRSLLKAGLATLGLAAIAIALARPQYGIEWSERKARGLDIVFVLDSSKSMLATDQRPNRLARAKLAVLDLVERLESDRVGLVAFAGQAFLQTPPTLDYAAFRESLESVGPESLSRGGSDLGRALQEAAKAFPVENNVKALVLLTDGEDLGGEAIQTAKEVAQSGIKVFAIGIGTAEGAYLQIRNSKGEESYLRDDEGQPVRSRLDEAALIEIASLTGGQYQPLGGASLDSFYASVIATLPRNERESEMQEIPIERFQWPLGAAFFFLILEIFIRRRRRPTISAASIGLFVFFQSLNPQPLSAEEEESVPPLPLEETIEDEATEDRKPHEVYNDACDAILAGDYVRARDQFDTAIRASEDFNLQRDALYNKGHSDFQLGEAAYQSGDFQQAIEQWKQSEAAFRSAAQIDPADTLAKADATRVEERRIALEKFLEEQEPQDNQEEQENSEKQQEPQENPEEQEEPQESDSEEDQEGNEQEQEQDSESNGEENSESGEDSSEGEKAEDSSEEGGRGEDEQENQSESEDSAESNSDSNETNESEETSEGAKAEETDEQQGESDPLPENTASEETDESSASSTATSEPPVEGMTTIEANALFDSMRGGEKLLPFVEQDSTQTGRQKQLKDW